MSDELPTPVRILLYFKNKQEVSESEFLANSKGQKNTRKTLELFVEKGVLLKKDGGYKKGPHFEITQKKMRKVFKQVGKLDKERENREWIVRGSLIETFLTLYRHILETLYRCGQKRIFLPLNLIYEALPFERTEVERFLMRESKRGLVGITRVLSRDITASQLFSRSPYRFYNSLQNLSPKEVEKVKEHWRASGAQVYEEDFVFGLYPREVVDRALGNLSSRDDLINMISEKSIDQSTDLEAEIIPLFSFEQTHTQLLKSDNPEEPLIWSPKYFCNAVLSIGRRTS